MASELPSGYLHLFSFVSLFTGWTDTDAQFLKKEDREQTAWVVLRQP